MGLKTEVFTRDDRGESFPEVDGEIVEVLDYKTDRMELLIRTTLPDDVITKEPDSEYLCSGKEDGQCSRTVENPGDVCWQHSED